MLQRERYITGLADWGHPGYMSCQRTSLRAEFALAWTTYSATPSASSGHLWGKRTTLLPSACPAPNAKTFLKPHPKSKGQVSERDRDVVKWESKKKS